MYATTQHTRSPGHNTTDNDLKLKSLDHFNSRFDRLVLLLGFFFHFISVWISAVCPYFILFCFAFCSLFCFILVCSFDLYSSFGGIHFASKLVWCGVNQWAKTTGSKMNDLSLALDFHVFSLSLFWSCLCLCRSLSNARAFSWCVLLETYFTYNIKIITQFQVRSKQLINRRLPLFRTNFRSERNLQPNESDRATA